MVSLYGLESLGFRAADAMSKPSKGKMAASKNRDALPARHLCRAPVICKIFLRFSGIGSWILVSISLTNAPRKYHAEPVCSESELTTPIEPYSTVTPTHSYLKFGPSCHWLSDSTSQDFPWRPDPSKP